MATISKLISLIIFLQTVNFAALNKCDTTIGYRSTIITCIESNCPKDSLITQYRNNKLERCHIYYSCKDSGMFLYFSPEGDTLTKSFFKSGKTVGLLQEWYNNKKIKRKCNYNSSGEKHGLSETWFENGNRKDSVVYNNGKIVEARYYFRNGKLRYTAKLKNGDIVKAVYFSPDGEKTGEIINGNGTVLIYDVDGLSPSEFKCKDGKWVD